MMQISSSSDTVQTRLFRPDKNANVGQEPASKTFKIKAPPVPSAAALSDKNKVLADKMISQLINVAQETNSTHANQEAQKTNSVHNNNKKYDGILTKERRRYLEDIVNNPQEAKKYAMSMAVGTDLFVIHKSSLGFDPDTRPDLWYEVIIKKQIAMKKQMLDVGQKRESFYKSQINEGISPTKIVANLYQFDANLPEYYWKSINMGVKRPYKFTEYYQAEHDYLQNLINQKELAKRATKSTGST